MYNELDRIFNDVLHDTISYSVRIPAMDHFAVFTFDLIIFSEQSRAILFGVMERHLTRLLQINFTQTLPVIDCRVGAKALLLVIVQVRDVAELDLRRRLANHYHFSDERFHVGRPLQR